MKTILSLILIFTGITLSAQENLYSFTVNDISGKQVKMSEFKGKKILIVNTASKCGYTPQYADLEKLYKEFGGEKFVIIGFPANNFMNQEPGTDDEIAEFCEKNYGVSFPMMSKISVKGNDIHPLYSWLTQKDKNGKMDSEVKWNFQKYLIDEQGRLVDFALPKEKPYDDKILTWLKN